MEGVMKRSLIYARNKVRVLGGIFSYKGLIPKLQVYHLRIQKNVKHHYH